MAAVYQADSDLSWVAGGWRELRPADAPAGQSPRPPVVLASVDASGSAGPVTLVRFDPAATSAPSYFLDLTDPTETAAPPAPVKVPILDVPAQRQSIHWGGHSGEFTVTVATVDAHDVLSTIMRYRAEFVWTDIVRAGTDPRYEVQNVSRLGATHVPAERWEAKTDCSW